MTRPTLSYPAWQAAHIAASRAVLSLYKRGRYDDARRLLIRVRYFKERMDEISDQRNAEAGYG